MSTTKASHIYTDAPQFVDYTKQDLATFFSQNLPSPKFNVILDAVGLADGSLYAKSEKYLAPGGVFVSVGPTPTGWSSTLQLLKLITDLVRPTWLGGVRRKWTCVCSINTSCNLYMTFSFKNGYGVPQGRGSRSYEKADCRRLVLWIRDPRRLSVLIFPDRQSKAGRRLCACLR